MQIDGVKYMTFNEVQQLMIMYEAKMNRNIDEKFMAMQSGCEQ